MKKQSWGTPMSIVAIGAIVLQATSAVLPAEFAQATEIAVQAGAPYTMECEELVTSQTQSNMGQQPFSQREIKRVQIYRVDPSAHSVTLTFTYRSQDEPWVEVPRTYNNVLITPAGRIVFCELDEGSACRVGKTETETLSSGETRTVVHTRGQTILFPSRQTVTNSESLLVSASDGSYYFSNSMTEGKCSISGY